MATFSVHFDGPITIEHRLPLRVMARTYENMQRSIDRAYLINRHGAVWKHARLKAEQYAETEFIAAYPREGGIYLDAVRDGANAIIDRINEAVRPIYERALQQGLEERANIAGQLQESKRYVAGMQERTRSFEDVALNPPADWADKYSNRSIIKEIDQLVHQITPNKLDGSIVELDLQGSRVLLPMVFDRARANAFHAQSAYRELGAPMIVAARIRNLDRGNKFSKPGAKILNITTNREVSLHLNGIDDADTLHPYHTGVDVRLYVCPILEAGGFDIHGGDLMFLAVA